MSAARPTFRNPVVRGIAPDPSVCRVGDDYYLANSTMDFWPGIAIRHSTDLVHWDLIGYAATRPEQFRRDGTGGPFTLFAPTLRHHDGTFFLACTNVAPDDPQAGFAGGLVGNFILHAQDPAGPWSDPVWVDADAFDPSLEFADGTCYYTRRSFTLTDTGVGLGPVVQGEIDPFTGKLLRAMTPISPATGGFCSNDIEGPHLYKIGGWYYLCSAEGGTGPGHMQTVARATSPWGPFEPAPHNPVLTHRHRVWDPLQCTGHAELVEGTDGSWWALFLGTRTEPHDAPQLLGRETFLAPVTWHDDWPVIGDGGTVDLRAEARTWTTEAPAPRPAADDPWLAGWSTRQAPLPGTAIDPTRGTVELPVSPHTLNESGPVAAAFLRQLENTAAFHATVTAAPLDAEAGITAYTAPDHHYDLYLNGTGPQRTVVLRRTAADLTTERAAPMPGDGPVALQVDCDGTRYTFTASSNGHETTVGTGSAALLDTRVAPGLASVRLGVYAHGNADGSARFENVGGHHVG